MSYQPVTGIAAGYGRASGLAWTLGTSLLVAGKLACDATLAVSQWNSRKEDMSQFQQLKHALLFSETKGVEAVAQKAVDFRFSSLAGFCHAEGGRDFAPPAQCSSCLLQGSDQIMRCKYQGFFLTRWAKSQTKGAGLVRWKTSTTASERHCLQEVKLQTLGSICIFHQREDPGGANVMQLPERSGLFHVAFCRTSSGH